jgi:3-dehydroquinate synthase
VVRVEVEAPGGAYPVLIGAGARRELKALLEGFAQVVVVRDLDAAEVGLDAVEYGIAGGEQAKTWDELRRLLGFLEAQGVGRDGCVVAVGGGSVGDLAGFAAAIWQRGIAHVQVPTTLLAMVDAAIGGKTAINTEHAKNAVGAFWQPRAVVADLDQLRTLPEPQLRSGLAEVVKYAVAMDADLAGILEREPAVSEAVIARCVELKGAVVAEDEREQTGRRAILNYGHTAGHALEASSGYSVLHGQAVAWGMRVAARIGRRVGACGEEVSARQDALLERFGLPGELPVVDQRSFVAAMSRDKKSAAGRVRWVMPRELGRAEPGWEIPPEVVEEAVTELLPA